MKLILYNDTIEMFNNDCFVGIVNFDTIRIGKNNDIYLYRLGTYVGIFEKSLIENKSDHVLEK